MTNALKRFFTGKIEDNVSNVLPAIAESNINVEGLVRTALREELPIILEMAMSHMRSELENIKETNRELLLTISDLQEQTTNIATTAYAGKTLQVIDEAKERATQATIAEVRHLLHLATNRQPEGYCAIYNKIEGRTGFSVYEEGKKSIRKSDGLPGGYSNPQKTYINTLLLHGYKDDLYIVATDILNS